METLYLPFIALASGVCFGAAQDLIDPKFYIGPCIVLRNEPCGNNLKFQLFNSYHQETPQDLDVIYPYTGEGFDPSLPTKLLIHGYGGGIDEVDPTPQIRQAYLKKEDVNIIRVNYPTTNNANLLCYSTSVASTLFVSYCTARLLLNLQKYYPGFNIEKTHAIGFSLGAHIAAFTSNRIQLKLGVKFTRITALDPAKPLYQDTSMALLDLDPTDAYFVDVIHTNAGFMGKLSPTGHVDFYVNGGVYQPACKSSSQKNLCSHLLAPVYYAESVSSTVGFYGEPCLTRFDLLTGCRIGANKPRAAMGDPAGIGPSGVFFVRTRSSPPYAQGK